VCLLVLPQNSLTFTYLHVVILPWILFTRHERRIYFVFSAFTSRPTYFLVTIQSLWISSHHLRPRPVI
jgi:hypothetical protein